MRYPLRRHIRPHPRTHLSEPPPDQPGSRDLLLLNHRPVGPLLPRSPRRDLECIHSDARPANAKIRTTCPSFFPNRGSAGRVHERFGGPARRVPKAGVCQPSRRLTKGHPNFPQYSQFHLRMYISPFKDAVGAPSTTSGVFQPSAKGRPCLCFHFFCISSSCQTVLHHCRLQQLNREYSG